MLFSINHLLWLNKTRPEVATRGTNQPVSYWHLCRQSCFSEGRSHLTVFKRACHRILSDVVESNPYPHNPVRSTWILFCHLLQDTLSTLPFNLSDCNLLCIHCVLYLPPLSPLDVTIIVMFIGVYELSIPQYVIFSAHILTYFLFGVNIGSCKKAKGPCHKHF